jgi:membrane protein
LKNTVKEFVDDDAMTFGAAVAFYTALSFAPLLVVLLVGLSLFMGDDAQARLVGQLNQLMGDQAGGVAQQVLQSADQPTLRNWAGVISLVMLVFSATGVFAQLQHALNLMWDVKAKPGAGLMGWVRKRVLSLGMILTIGFLLIVSLAVSTAIQAMLGGHPPEDGSGGGTVGATFWAMLNAVVSVGVFTVLFGLMFRFLPDARVDWGDVWQGALLTAILFTVGKWAIGTYLGMASVGSAYGAAGSLLVLLVWVYYSCLILFIGAEFTQVWAKRSGKPIEPDEHAVALERSTAGA